MAQCTHPYALKSDSPSPHASIDRLQGKLPRKLSPLKKEKGKKALHSVAKQGV